MSSVPSADLSVHVVPASNFPNSEARYRRRDIDSLRAIACLALVSYHVVGADAAVGLELARDHWLSTLNRVPIDLRMPLFSFLSGMVFVAVSPRGAMATMTGKARRLLVPMISVGSLFWIIRDVVGIPQAPYWTLFVLPYGHFWFLQATVWIMATMLMLTALLGGRDRIAAIWMMAVTIPWWIAGPRATLDFFAINEAIRLAPFFAAGFLIVRMHRVWQMRRSAGGAVPARRGTGLAVLALVILVGSVLAVLPDAQGTPWRRAATLVIGGAGCLALVMVRPRSLTLAMLGRQSYAIYLFHVFFTAGLREVALWWNPALPAEVLFLPCLLAGVAGPVLVASLALRHPVTALLCLGVQRPGAARMPRSGYRFPMGRGATPVGVGLR